MNADTLSVFIEANRFPPAVNAHRYSIIRAEADAVAEHNIRRASRSYAAPKTNTICDDRIYELEGNEDDVSSSSSFAPSSSASLPALSEMSVMSPFNPFDEAIPSPPSPLPERLRPTVDADALPSPLPPVSKSYLPFISKSAPFDPYKEKYVPHPTGPYAARRFQERSRMSVAPTERPVTPNFSDESSSDEATADTDTPPECPISHKCPEAFVKMCNPRRKPLSLGVEPFTPSKYPPPGSSSYDAPQHNHSAGPLVISSASHSTSRSIMHTTPILSPAPRTSTQKSKGKSAPKLNKPLPPLPSLSSKPRSQHSSQRANAPLNHRAGWEQEERRVTPVIRSTRTLHQPLIAKKIPTPVTAANILRSDLRGAKMKLGKKWLALS
ncbi:hypothetical protein E4T38_04764 [Aureobasidium subglaciale]|nr:hypothetical protein E4T38_04764 [Aureobasidium subglaciale]KAI5223060.1 hypothetical protein E4T40_04639 [Aureobasidium subglaciale]KAI5226701.1 hypothetical protein E4T41_04582 [Aureobasidium subglaciale]KAI5262386.1 hypothetical protein E4T46_04468 [Aureobasidium subglaciale]